MIPASLQQTSLRRQVYDVLRENLNQGRLRPGDTIRLDAIAGSLGVSRTPLREALLRLELEGFVTIKPRSGIIVRRLTERDIRNLYQMIGALEAAVLLEDETPVPPEVVARMEAANSLMATALERDDFDAYYAANLDLHDAYIALTANEELVERLRVMKQRLYDFPRKRHYHRDWEENSTREHEQIVSALRFGDRRKAARLVREVHWSFAAQEAYIREYYRDELERE